MKLLLVIFIALQAFLCFVLILVAAVFAYDGLWVPCICCAGIATTGLSIWGME